MDRAAVERIIGATVAALGRGQELDATSLRFLLRCYIASDRADIRQALEPALAQALDRHAHARTIPERAQWLVLFAEALSVSADSRLSESAVDLVTALRHNWGQSLDLAPAARSIEACLRASGAVEVNGLVSDAFDELERIVAATYRPGHGIGNRSAPASGAEGPCADHVVLSSALLTAYDVSGRLPYSMLAEELMQYARRTFWNAAAAVFRDELSGPAEIFRLNCDAVRTLCALATLHADDQYRRAAVVHPEAAYADDAASLLTSLQTRLPESYGLEGAYGLALIEWLALG
jgi:hypothetical protein